MNAEIGKRILAIRQSMNMNKEKFGKLIGISGQYLGTVESGAHGLALDTLMRLCEATNSSADYILFGKENISNENLKEIFVGIEESQITRAFYTLQNVALSIKAKERMENKKLETV